jgi:hypothetical protein
MPASRPEDSPDLEFPPAQADPSLTQLGLYSLMMRSTTTRLPEQLASSLDDSSYDILGDSLVEVSDDEARTESIASTEPPTPDDASAFSDDDEFENDYTNLDRSLQSLHTGEPDQDVETPLEFNGEDSTLTEVARPMEGSGKLRSMQLEEHHLEDSVVIQGSEVLRSFPDPTSEMPQTLTRYNRRYIRLVVKAGLAEHVMSPPDSYKILYIGTPEKWLEDVITAQIGAALTVSPSVSRSVMVRGQMEPYGPVIHVYRSTSFHVSPKDQEPVHVSIRLDDGEELVFGAGHTPHSDSKPDLVIFCLPSTSAPLNKLQEFRDARAIFSALKIPSIDMAKVRPYGDGTDTYDLQSLAMCIEGRDDEDADFELQEALPLDYYTFSEWDPSQLNRHLASISPHLAVSKAKAASNASELTPKSMRRILPTKLPASSTLALSFIVLVGMVSAMLLNPVYTTLLFEKISNSVEPHWRSPITASSSSLMSATLPSQSVKSALISASVKPPLTGSTLVPQAATPEEKRVVSTDGKSGGFNIQTTGDHEFLLTPSKDLVNAKKKPQLQIHVTQKAETVPIHYNRTLTGAYVVGLENQHPFGAFHVIIASHSKPLLEQSFDIMLGHNKSRLTQLLDDSICSVIDTQKILWDASSTAMQHVQEKCVTATQRVQQKLSGVLGVDLQQLTDEVRHVEQELIEHLRNTKAAVVHNRGAGYRMLKDLPRSTWKGVRKATAPVRTSRTLWKARMNALRLRCKMEMATGLSPKDSKEARTWACARVGMLDDTAE